MRRGMTARNSRRRWTRTTRRLTCGLGWPRLHLRSRGNASGGDSAYRSAEIAAKLAERGQRSRFHRRPVRNRPLTVREQQGNTTRSRVRARVEHVFGHQAHAIKGKLARTIDPVRARIGMQNLAYDISRV